MPEENEPPEPSLPEQSTLLGNIAPDEMLARGMQSVKMTSAASGTWQPPTLQECAQLFPGYEVLRLLGRGGMGAVYQARQIELDRLVAIKLLPLEISVDKDFADRFRREARAMARLNHPNIIAVYDFGTTREGHLFFVMEFVEGANLYDIIHQVGLDGDQSLSIVEQVCTALAYAHHKGIVHRDIKPANVMIDTESHVKVADFGLARLTDNSAPDLGHTMTGTVMGTPDYMAPEQMKGMNVDHRADIYSVGVMIYEMLCREVPKGIFDPPSHRTGCDARIDQIVIRAMQQVPDRRYQSTTEMKSDILSARHPVIVPDAEPAMRVSALPAKPAPPGPPKKLAPPKVPGAAAPQKPALPSLAKPAVMQAIALPAPKKKNSVLLYAGIALAVVVIPALGAFFLFRKTSVEAKANAQREDAPAAAGAEHWQDLLSDPAKLTFLKQIERTPEGLRMGENSAVYSASIGSSKRDGAVRLRTTYGGLSPAIRARSANGPNYQLSVGSKNIVTLLRNIDYGKTQSLSNFRLKKPLQPGQEYELELRVVGPNLTAKLDGEVLGTVTDSNLSQGNFGVAVAGTGTAVVVKSIEFLDLDGPGSAPPVPAAQANAVSPGLWQDLLHGSVKLSIQGPAELTPDGLRFTGAASVWHPEHFRDAAVRVRTTYGTIDPQLRARITSAAGSYCCNLRDGREVLLQRWDATTEKAMIIRDLPLPAPLQPGQEYELELRVNGQTLTVSFNGVVLGVISDATFTEGGFGVGVTGSDGGSVVVKAFELLDLDTPAKASPSSAPGGSATALQYPPGQWVKMFTKAEDLPAELRKPDSGVKWEDGWIRHVGDVPKALAMPFSLTGNYGVRARFLRGTGVGNYSGMDLRCPPVQAHLYRISLDASGWLKATRREGDNIDTIVSSEKATPVAVGAEYTLEAGAVGHRLIGRCDGVGVISGIDDLFKKGRCFVNGVEDVRDIEVISLDGLPEAKALRLLGVDENGNELRGKTGTAAEIWQDVARFSPDKIDYVKGAAKTGSGFAFPANGGSLILRATQTNGAIRMRLTLGDAPVDLTARGSANGDSYTLRLEKGAPLRLMRWDDTAKRNISIRDFPLEPPLQVGQQHELELRVVGQTLSATLDGKRIGSVNDATIPAGRFGVGNHATNVPAAAIESLEILDLDGAHAVAP